MIVGIGDGRGVIAPTADAVNALSIGSVGAALICDWDTEVGASCWHHGKVVGGVQGASAGCKIDDCIAVGIDSD